MSIFVPSRIDSDDSDDNVIQSALRQLAKHPDRFSIEPMPWHNHGSILTCIPLPMYEDRNHCRIKLYLDEHRRLTQVEAPMLVESGSINAPLPSFPDGGAKAAGRAPAWTCSLGVSTDSRGKARPRPSPTSPAQPNKKICIGDDRGASAASRSPNCIEDFHRSIPAHWRAEARAAALSLGYFERQSQMRCLQHAYNNLMGARLFELPEEMATLGTDIDLVCSQMRGTRQPLTSLVLDRQQLRALIPELADHMSGLIVFRGNLENGEGHYQALRKINGEVFLLDSLKSAPEWMPQPALYFNELLKSPGKLVGAMPPQGSPVLERYVDFLSHHVRQDIARGLGDVYGIQPIKELEEYFRSQEMTAATAEQLAGYFLSKHVAARTNEWVFDDAAALCTIDATLNAAANGHKRVLLMTHSHPYLIPAFFSEEQGGWQGRVLNAEGDGMETRRLQLILDRQQREYEDMHAQTRNPERQQEISLQRRSLGAVWLEHWPSQWPSAHSPMHAGARDAIDFAGQEEMQADNDASLRRQVGDVHLPWKTGATYSVSGHVSGELRKIITNTRLRTQEFVHHGYDTSLADVRAISRACDAVPGKHIGAGVFIHDGVRLKEGQPAKRVYRRLDIDHNVLDIGIPIVGKVAVADFVSTISQRSKKTGQAGRSEEVIDFNTEYIVRQRMFDPVLTLYPLMGNKISVLEEDPSGTVLEALYAALNAPKVSSFVDAFAGTGYLTLWLTAQQRRGHVKSLRLVMNEWDQYRHNTLKTVQQHPERVKQALNAHLQRLKYLYYRVFNDYPVYKKINGKKRRETDLELARRIASHAGKSDPSMSSEELLRFLNHAVDTWVRTAEISQPMNLKLSTELKDYLLDSIDFPLPPEPQNPSEKDIELRASNAAIYLLAQHNGRVASAPINFTRSNVKRPNMRKDGLMLGGNRRIANKLLDNALAISNTEQKRMDRKSSSSRLKMELNAAGKSGDQRRFFQNLPFHIDHVSDALTGVAIQQGDGWALLRGLREGTLAVIDPPYWDLKSSREKPLKYTAGSAYETTKHGFLKNLDQYVMPAWEQQKVHVMVFNQLDTEIGDAMRKRGFSVFSLTNFRSTNPSKNQIREMMAINFLINADATLLRPVITHAAPEAPLGVPGETSSEDEVSSVEMS